jgi:Sec-independent protein translocase protein TatA
MLLEFGWLEVVVIFGLLLVVFGPERVNEFVGDLRTLWRDTTRVLSKKRR